MYHVSVSVISISLCISQLFSLWILWCLELKISDPFRSCMQKFCTPFSFMHVGVRNLYFVYLDHWRYTELTSQGNVKIDPLINEKQMSKNMRGVRERERETNDPFSYMQKFCTPFFHACGVKNLDCLLRSLKIHGIDQPMYRLSHSSGCYRLL